MFADHCAKAVREGLRERTRCQVQAALPPSLAQSLGSALSLPRGIGWELTAKLGQETRNIPMERLGALQKAERLEVTATIVEQARHSFQFQFWELPLRLDAHKRFEGAAPALADFAHWLASADARLVWEELTGLKNIVHVVAFASRYDPGHFLLPHTDAVNGESRRYAFVINLSGRWRPEWGGQLQFLSDDGQIAESMLPIFNSLVVFEVPQLHQVSYIAPYALMPRLAISGWLHAD
jgi:SM-20-related protein